MLQYDGSAFNDLSLDEMYGVEGGIFGMDDALFWTLVAIGFGAGVTCGASRRARSK